MREIHGNKVSHAAPCQQGPVGIEGGDCTHSLRGIDRNLMPRIAQHSASGFPQSTSVSTTSNFPALECIIVSLGDGHKPSKDSVREKIVTVVDTTESFSSPRASW